MTDKIAIDPKNVDASALSLQDAKHYPAKVTTFEECAQAVFWLRLKNEFDASVDKTFEESIKLAHQSHKAALKVAKDAKASTEAIKENLRAQIEAYAEDPGNKLPEGVFRRPEFAFVVTEPDKLPEMYKIPNQKLIQEFIKRTEGKVKIPGVEVFPSTAITVRSGGE